MLESIVDKKIDICND